VIEEPDWRQDETLHRLAKRQITDYFAGNRDGFDFPITFIGTGF
jgi:hypothetical protein